MLGAVPHLVAIEEARDVDELGDVTGLEQGTEFAERNMVDALLPLPVVAHDEHGEQHGCRQPQADMPFLAHRPAPFSPAGNCRLARPRRA